MDWGQGAAGAPAPMQVEMIMLRLASILLLTVLGANVASARTWHVRKDGTGDYTVIQDAVDHAAAGDTIRIGPGRFEEKRPYTSYPPVSAPKWTFDVYVAVDVADLTIIGSGAEQTIIGPPARLWVDPEQPKIICALSRVQRLVVEDLAMENVFGGIYKDQGGTLEIRRCRTRGCRAGVSTWSDQGTSIEDCIFQDIDYGVISSFPARHLTIVQCEFVRCSASFDFTIGATVADCKFDGYVVGCQYANNSSGSVCGSSFTDQTNVGIAVITGSVVSVVGNQVSGSAVNFGIRSRATVTGLNNDFSGGSFATIWISNSNLRLRDGQILHGGGPTILADTYLNPPVLALDLINNYWGTDSTEVIANWIVDGHDDPAVNAVVQFEPFLGQPVSSESTSWGDLKALWR